MTGCGSRRTWIFEGTATRMWRPRPAIGPVLLCHGLDTCADQPATNKKRQFPTRQSKGCIVLLVQRLMPCDAFVETVMGSHEYCDARIGIASQLYPGKECLAMLHTHIYDGWHACYARTCAPSDRSGHVRTRESQRARKIMRPERTSLTDRLDRAECPLYTRIPFRDTVLRRRDITYVRRVLHTCAGSSGGRETPDHPIHAGPLPRCISTSTGTSPGDTRYSREHISMHSTRRRRRRRSWRHRS